MTGIMVIVVLALSTTWYFSGSGISSGTETDSTALQVPGAINYSYESLKEGEGREIVVANCTACHSDKMIIQNRATRDGWRDIIRWMQETQRLWDLGANEDIILNYLEANYAPEENAARRKTLENVEWYKLD